MLDVDRRKQISMKIEDPLQVSLDIDSKIIAVDPKNAINSSLFSEFCSNSILNRINECGQYTNSLP
jgi:hypothetical protein